MYQRITERHAGTRWPLDHMADQLADANLYGALIGLIPDGEVSAEHYVRARAGEFGFQLDEDAPWAPCGLGEMVVEIIADHLFGELPDVLLGDGASDAARERLAQIVELNDWPNELHAAQQRASAQKGILLVVGLDARTDVGREVPVFNFYGNDQTNLRFIGNRLVEAQIVHTYRHKQAGQQRDTVYRLVETHTPGSIRYQLFQGRDEQLGQLVPLDIIEETEGLTDEQVVPDGMFLCHYIPTRRIREALGESDLKGIEPYLLAYCEAFAQAQREFTANETVVFAQESLLKKGPRNGERRLGRRTVVGVGGKDSVMGEKPLLEVTENKYDPSKATTWLDWLQDTATTVKGIAPQTSGRGTPSGVEAEGSKRLAVARTLIKVAVKERYWVPALKAAVRQAMRLDALDGFEKPAGGTSGYRFTDVDIKATLTIALNDGLPDDPAANAAVIAQVPDAFSGEEKVRQLHPDWGEQQVQEELARIAADREASALSNDSPFADLLNQASGQ